jgi:hypothetical protein
MRCCAEDEGFVALRSRPAGGGFKPPHAALAEDCRGERCGKGGERAVRQGPGRRTRVNHRRSVERVKRHQNRGLNAGPGMSLADTRLLARRCPACRWREPGLRLACGNTGRRVLIPRLRWGGRERERAKRQKP